jgi:hypothetical protein
VVVSGGDLQLDSFEELAMPLFDHLYNFAHWLTQNREEAEDLVQETYAKALKGFSSFQLASKGCALLSFLLFLVPPSSAASPEPEVISFQSGEITLQGTYTSRKEKDHFLRSFTTMGVLLACSANRHSKHSGPCLQGTDGYSSDLTGEAKA